MNPFAILLGGGGGGDTLLAQGIYLTVFKNELPLSACESHVDPALSQKNWPIRESHVNAT